MCASYWNLRDVKFTCPACKAETSDDLQTHFPDGYCTEYYEIGERVKWLGDMTVTLGDPKDGCPDDFVGQCGECDAFIDFGARIENGAVMEVWPYRVVA